MAWWFVKARGGDIAAVKTNRKVVKLTCRAAFFFFRDFIELFYFYFSHLAPSLLTFIGAFFFLSSFSLRYYSNCSRFSLYRVDRVTNSSVSISVSLN